MKTNDNSATLAGGVAGGATATGIGIAASGASASTITWALGALGGLVGGGMAAGIAVVAAAPVAIGGAAYGTTKLIKKIRRK